MIVGLTVADAAEVSEYGDGSAISAGAVSDGLSVAGGSVDELAVVHHVFSGRAGALAYGVHYACYHSGAHEITFVSARDLVYEDGVFSGGAAHVQVLSYDQATSVLSGYQLVSSDVEQFVLSSWDGLLFSDLGDFPVLYNRGEEDYQHVEVIIAAAVGLLVAFRYIYLALWGRRY